MRALDPAVPKLVLRNEKVGGKRHPGNPYPAARAPKKREALEQSQKQLVCKDAYSVCRYMYHTTDDTLSASF